MGRSIKLLGKCKNEDNQVVASVAPRLLAPDHPLFNVSGVVNGILVRGNMVGDLVFIVAQESFQQPAQLCLTW